MASSVGAGAASLAAFLGVSAMMGGVAGRVEPEIVVPQGMNQTQQEKLEQMAGVSLFGQFRSTMSDFLWVKVDKYMHNGVDLRGTTPLEKEVLKNGDVHSAPGEAAQGNREHSNETTIVPTRQRDWRGALGDLEREMHPFTDMESHKHRDPKEALPLFRLMTAANPHFIAGYVTGASMIAREKSKIPDAIAFLQEGERNNPYSVEVQQALGMMYTAKLRQYEAGKPYLLHAIEFAARRDAKAMSEDETEAYRNAFRWLILNRREAGRMEEAHDAARAGLRVFPHDPLCRLYTPVANKPARKG